MTTRIRRFVAAAAASTLVLVATGCSATIDSVPLPAPGVGSDSYRITAVFANALNLPTNASVKLFGADVGEVESMVSRNYTAEVTMKISDGVRVPVGTRAELRSATPIGDVFVGLTPPDTGSDGGRSLAEGDTIPLADTSAAATVEDLLSRVSLVVNGGAIRNLTTIANNVGERVDGRGERIGDLVDNTTRLVGNLSGRSGELAATVSSAEQLAETLAADKSALGDALGAAGPAMTTLSDNTGSIVGIVDQLNGVTSQLARFPSVQGTGGRSLSADINTLAANMKVAANDPQSDLPTVTRIFPQIARMLNAQTAHVDLDVAKFALGTSDDPNTPRNDEARLPSAIDWANFVGSLTYTLTQLQQKVVGSGR